MALDRHVGIRRSLNETLAESGRQRADLLRQLQIKEIELQTARTVEDNMVGRIEILEKDYGQ